MKDASGQLIDPILRYVIDLRRGAIQGEHPSLESVRADLLGRFFEAEQKALSSTATASGFSLIKCALVYWTDEVLINSSWRHADAWRSHILEWEFFKENVGGERFYERADEAERLTETDPLEVFFVCVALGFRGRLGMDRVQLKAWIDRLYGRLAASNQPPERFLAEDESQKMSSPIQVLPGQTMMLRMSILVSISAILSLAGFLYAIQQY